MNAELLLPIAMFITLFALILSGFPVAFGLAGSALICGIAGHYAEIFIWTDFGLLPARIFELIIQNFTLVAVPLFVFMGVTLEKSGIAADLLHAIELVFRGMRGGLNISLIVVGALLAASTGIVGATVVTMGIISLPPMIARGYNKELACGTVAASGTLGQIIPPSIVLVLLGDMMNVAVADLFAGAILPGLMLVAMYIAYVYIRSTLNPDLAPALVLTAEETQWKAIWGKFFLAILPPLTLIILVLGSILAGAASPTESAACGAVGALVLALLRGKLSFATLKETMSQTSTMTTMVFTLLIGAQFFSVVFRGLYGDQLIADFINSLAINRAGLLFVIMAIVFFLGFFLDFIEICFIVIPIVGPILVNQLGFDGIWISILFAVNLQTSFLTPPFGFALFYLKGVAPNEVKTSHIYRGVFPFVALQLVALGLLAYFPWMATWLPKLLFG